METPSLRPYFFTAIILLLTACGGGGGSSSPGDTNSSGFPEVAGRYSFNTGTVNMSCSDGSTGTNPAIALNFDLTQNANAISLLSTSAGGPTPGLTFIESTGLTGNVQTNSEFIVTQRATANVDGISGIVNINYNLTGSFSSNGWSGTYTFTTSSSSIGSCTFTASFTGTKISTTTAKASSHKLIESIGLPVDIYDQFGIIGSSVGVNE